MTFDFRAEVLGDYSGSQLLRIQINRRGTAMLCPMVYSTQTRTAKFRQGDSKIQIIGVIHTRKGTAVPMPLQATR